jgi:hypothetical protein
MLGADAEVMMDPSSGELDAVQTLAVAVTVMVRRPGPLDMLIGCDVEAARMPLVCAVVGEVCGERGWPCVWGGGGD